MSGDDKETKKAERSASGRLPPRVERALAAAREAARADRSRKEGRWLVAIPIGMGVLFFALLMPRAAEPESVPLPRVDLRAVTQVERTDDRRASSAEAERLPTYVLAVGGALRALNALDVKEKREGDDELERIDARRRLDGTVRDLPAKPEVEEELLSLRALQTRHFLDAVARWEATGNADVELDELGGRFVERTREAGWVVGRSVLLSPHERRVAFKTVWNSLVGVEGRPAFAITLDEQRLLYAFYIQHPHPPESQRLGLALDRSGAKDPVACLRVNLEHQRQSDLWLAEKLKKLGGLDPTYPTDYALGVAYFRATRYDLSVAAFASFLKNHPDGDYALRAKNHLRAATIAQGTF